MADVHGTDLNGSDHKDRISIGDADDLVDRDCTEPRCRRPCDDVKASPDAFRKETAVTDGSLPGRQPPRQRRVLSNESQSFLNRFRTQTSSRSLNIPSSYNSWTSFSSTDDDRKPGFFSGSRKFLFSNRNSSPSRGSDSVEADFSKPRKWYSFSNLWGKSNVANLISLPRSRLSVSSTLNSVFLGNSSPTETAAFDHVNNFYETKKPTYSSTSCISNRLETPDVGDLIGDQTHRVILRSPVSVCYSVNSQIDFATDVRDHELINFENGLTARKNNFHANSINQRNGNDAIGERLLCPESNFAEESRISRRATLPTGECPRRSRLSCSEFFPHFPSVTEIGEPSNPVDLPGNVLRDRATDLPTRKTIGRSLPTLLQAMESGMASHGSAFPGYSHVTTQDVFDLLYQEFAILTGAKSIDDHYTIIFPDRGNFHLLAEQDYRRLMCYLTSIPPMEDTEAGFVLIIDRRNDKWNSMKFALLRLSNYFPGVIHRVLVLRPTSFLQKALSEVTSKLFRGDSTRFNLTMCNNVSDLLVYVNSDQLTTDFGGRIVYDKAQWTRQRIDVEAFEAALKHLSKELKCFTDSFVDLEYPNDTASTKALMDLKSLECQRLQKELQHASKYGEELLSRIKNGAPLHDVSNSLTSTSMPTSPQAMQLINVISVERFIVQVDETEKLFLHFWSKERSSLERCLKLREFEQNFKDLQVVFDGHTQKLRATPDMGDCVALTEQFIEETINFQSLAAQDIKTATELEARGRDIVAEISSAIDTVEPKCVELSSMALSLRELLNIKLKTQKEWREVQLTVERANKLCQEGMDLLTSLLHSDDGDCVDSGVNLKKIDAFLEIVQTISIDVSRTKSLLSCDTTAQCRNLLKQVQKRIDDLHSMLVKKRTQLTQQISRVKLRRDSQSENRDDVITGGLDAPLLPSSSSGLYATVSTSDDCAGIRKVARLNNCQPSHANGQKGDQRSLSRESSSCSMESTAEARKLKRGHVLKELLNTESTYVQEMGDILNGYQHGIDRPEVRNLLPHQLLSANKHGGKSPNMGVLFGNLDDLYKFHAVTFLPDLSNCISSLELVGLCFIQRHVDFLSLYSRYCQLLPASENLRREIGENHPWFVACRQKLDHKLPLGAYLLKPVQRITKYQLLLKDLIKYSEDCEGYSVLLNALENMLIVLRCVNDGMLQLSIVGYPGKLVEEGPLLLQGSFLMWTETKKDKLRLKGHQRHLFLYQKCVLICKKDKDVKSSSLYLKHRIDLSEIGLTEALRGSGSTKKFEIWVQGRSKVFVFQAESQQIKDNWVHSIKKLLMEQLESLRLMKSSNDNSVKASISAKRTKMLHSKGASLNGWRTAVNSHRPLRAASSWAESQTKHGSMPSDVEGDEDASSGLSNSEDEDTVSGSQSSRINRPPLIASQNSSSLSFGSEAVPVENSNYFIALADYNAVGPGEISFKEGDKFMLTKTGCGGWWFISAALESGKIAEGWAPSAFLEPLGEHANRATRDIVTVPADITPAESIVSPNWRDTSAGNELKDQLYTIDSPASLLR